MGTEKAYARSDKKNGTQPSYKFNKLVNCSLFTYFHHRLFSLLVFSPHSIQYSTTNDNDHRWMNCIHKHHHVSAREKPTAWARRRRRNWEPPLLRRGGWEAGSLASRGTSSTFTVFWCSMTKLCLRSHTNIKVNAWNAALLLWCAMAMTNGYWTVIATETIKHKIEERRVRDVGKEVRKKIYGIWTWCAWTWALRYFKVTTWHPQTLYFPIFSDCQASDRWRCKKPLTWSTRLNEIAWHKTSTVKQNKVTLHRRMKIVAEICINASASYHIWCIFASWNSK